MAHLYQEVHREEDDEEEHKAAQEENQPASSAHQCVTLQSVIQEQTAVLNIACKLGGVRGARMTAMTKELCGRSRMAAMWDRTPRHNY